MMDSVSAVKSGQSTDAVCLPKVVAVAGALSLSYLYKRCLERLSNSVDSLRSNFFDIGKCLSEIKSESLFSVPGYKDVYELADAEFGIKSTTVKNLINVYESFKDSNGNLDKRFSGCSAAKLVELLPLAADDKDFCASLTQLNVADVRAIKKISYDSGKDISKKAGTVINGILEIVSAVLKSRKVAFSSKLSKNSGYSCAEQQLVVSVPSLSVTFNVSFSYDFSGINAEFDDEYDVYYSDSRAVFSFSDVKFVDAFYAFVEKGVAHYSALKSKSKASEKKLNSAVAMSAVAEDPKKPEKKPCTLKNNAVRLDYVRDQKNWEFIQDVPALAMKIYRLKAIPNYCFLYITVGSDGFSGGNTYDCDPGFTLSSVTESSIVNSLKDMGF